MRFQFLFLPFLINVAYSQTTSEYFEHIQIYEGYSFCRYNLRNVFHIGIGHKILSKEKFNQLTDNQIDELFLKDLEKAKTISWQLVPSFPQHPKVIRILIVALAFNLGKSGFMKFYKFRKALNCLDYRKAAQELSNSLWATQLPERARDYINVLNKYANISY